MFKPRVAFLPLIIVLFISALGGVFYFYFLSEQEPAQLFPATVSGDCAPWDGGAFTVSVQYDPGTTITISIWKSPDLPYRTSYSFPDASGQMGNAYLAPGLTSYTPLEGRVVLQSVSVDTPIEGRFRFKSERGRLFEGRFKAEWRDEVIFCG